MGKSNLARILSFARDIRRKLGDAADMVSMGRDAAMSGNITLLPQNIADTVNSVSMMHAVLIGGRVSQPIISQSSVDSASSALGDALNQMKSVESYMRKTLVPKVSRMIVLGAGNREDGKALDWVKSKFSGNDLGEAIADAKVLIDKLDQIYAALEVQDSDEAEFSKELVSIINKKAISHRLTEAFTSLLRVAPGMLIAPQNKVYASERLPWIPIPHQDGWEVARYAEALDAGNVAATNVVTTATFAWDTSNKDHFEVIYLKNDGSSGYTEMPPKSSLYNWVARCEIKAALTPDSNFATSAATTLQPKVRGWVADSVGGTLISQVEKDVNWTFTTTPAGVDVVYIHATIDVPFSVLSSGASSTSQAIHLDWGLHQVGGVGWTLSAQTYDVDVTFLGYPKNVAADASMITYKDSDGLIRAIDQGDTFMKYLGMLSDHEGEDPYYSVRALWLKKVATTEISAIVAALQAWSAKVHPSGATLDDKYNKLGCTSGMDDLLEPARMLDVDNAPFGKNLAARVSADSSKELIFATLITDIEIAMQTFDFDDSLLGALQDNLAALRTTGVTV
jgi:hypothetical protein